MARDGGVFCRRKRSEVAGVGFDDVSPSDSQDLHVLAVDDSLVDRKVIESLLKISSCKVTAVDSGRRALQFLGLDEDDEEESSVTIDGLKVDMIITDYCMPGMTGYELLKKIKGSSNLRQIPVVIMSSENVLARIDRCLEEGAEDFIVKPVKLSDVKRLTDYMFGEERLGNKRKEPEPSDQSPRSSLPPVNSLAPSPSSSTPDSSSPESSPPAAPPPPPSPPLCSPTRRLRMTSCE